VASIITTSPLIGGPHWRDLAKFMGVTHMRAFQLFVGLFIYAVSFVPAFVPLYMNYLSNMKGKREDITA